MIWRVARIFGFQGANYRAPLFFPVAYPPARGDIHVHAELTDRTLTLNGQNNGGIIRTIVASIGIYSDAA